MKLVVRKNNLQYSLPDCYPGVRGPDCYSLGFFPNFRKNTPKNTTKSENIPGLLHFFDIFCNSPGVSTVQIGNKTGLIAISGYVDFQKFLKVVILRKAKFNP